jgi:preprotein translocase subunit YajC
MIRPQRKQEKGRQEMLKALQKNDKVVTMGGLYGVVTNVRDKDVTIKIDESKDVRVKVLRSAISHVIAKEEEGEQGAQA